MTTNTTKHTPGPWHIGMKPGPIIYGPKGECVADMYSEPALLEHRENLANARLIAAAPDLLAALKEFCCYVEAYNPITDKRVEPYYKQARRALAQAEGRE